MKKLTKIISFLTLLFSFQSVALAEFIDVSTSHENYVAIMYLNETETVQGYEDNTFKPEQLVNRVEALKIILEGNNVEISEDVEDNKFTDVNNSDWFTKYIMSAKTLGIVEGNPDGSFAPARNVANAEFVKMLLITNSFSTEQWEGLQIFPDIGQDEWYTPYMNYAGQAGIVTKDNDSNLNPGKELTRGEVAETIYLMTVILKGGDTQFLITQSENQMAQIDIYVGANNPDAAKRASELSVDMTQQAYKNMPEDSVVLGAAKLARAYDFLMNSYISGIAAQNDESRDWAQQAIDKATEAWEVNNDLQPIAKHIKDRANEVISQLPTAT